MKKYALLTLICSLLLVTAGCAVSEESQGNGTDTDMYKETQTQQDDSGGVQTDKDFSDEISEGDSGKPDSTGNDDVDDSETDNDPDPGTEGDNPGQKPDQDTEDTPDVEEENQDEQPDVDDTPETCNPAEYPKCKNYQAALTCEESGDIKEIPCPEEKVCSEGSCVDKLCTPYEKRCSESDDAVMEICHASGLKWESVSCGDNHYCDPEKLSCECEYPINIMFVVDASGSMKLKKVGEKTQWEVAKEAISTVMESYPRLNYGLATFPDKDLVKADIDNGKGGCLASYTDSVIFDIKLSEGEDRKAHQEKIRQHLESRKLAEKPKDLKFVQTPLLNIFDFFSNTYPEEGPLKTNNGVPTYIVLISDGEDVCNNPINKEWTAGPLGNMAKKLTDWKIKTYAIGFNLDEGAGEKQLNAVAMNGGTGRSTFIPATNIADLKKAFDDILDEINPRDCSGADVVIKNPDCQDADGDWWCSTVDCDDSNEAVNPGAAQQDETKDWNCNGHSVKPDKIDQDGDGKTPAQGDCDDFEKLIGPDAIEVSGDSIDNNCNDQVDEAIGTCDNSMTLQRNDPSGNARKLARAMGVCPDKGLVSATLGLAGDPVAENLDCYKDFNGNIKCREKNRQSLDYPYFREGGDSDTVETYAAEPAFGDVVVAKEGKRLAVLSTGEWDRPSKDAFSTTLKDGDMRTASRVPEDWINRQLGCESPMAPACGGTKSDEDVENSCAGKEIPIVQDPIMLTMNLKVPQNAKSFSFESYFFTAEYPDSVCSVYNDFFIALLGSSFVGDGDRKNPHDKNLAMDASGNPVGVNLAPDGLFKICSKNDSDYPRTDSGAYKGFCTGKSELTGTGFDYINFLNQPSAAANKKSRVGGGTGWMVTRGNVVPGETIKLRIALWEQGFLKSGNVLWGPDHSWDSTVVLDNFQWHTEEVKPGTEPLD